MKSVDILGREYGWTIDEVRRLTIAEHNELMRIIQKRKRESKNG